MLYLEKENSGSYLVSIATIANSSPFFFAPPKSSRSQSFQMLLDLKCKCRMVHHAALLVFPLTLWSFVWRKVLPCGLRARQVRLARLLLILVISSQFGWVSSVDSIVDLCALVVSSQGASVCVCRSWAWLVGACCRCCSCCCCCRRCEFVFGQKVSIQFSCSEQSVEFVSRHGSSAECAEVHELQHWHGCSSQFTQKSAVQPNDQDGVSCADRACVAGPGCWNIFAVCRTLHDQRQVFRNILARSSGACPSPGPGGRSGLVGGGFRASLRPSWGFLALWWCHLVGMWYWEAATACQVLPDRWFSPHFAVRTDFSIAAWMPLLRWPRCTLPFGLLAGFNVPIAPADLLLKQFRTSGMFTFRSSATCPSG